MRHSRAWRIVLAITAGTLIGGAIAVAVALRDGVVKRRVVEALSDRLNSDVTIGPLSVSLFPSVRVMAEGLSVRRRVDPPDHHPIIEASRFKVEPGLWHLLNGRAKYVEVEGLRVTIPRRQSGQDAHGAGPVAPLEPGALTPPEKTQPASTGGILDVLVARDAQLIYSSGRTDRPPRTIHVQLLELGAVGFDHPMTYRAALTNPVPEGPLETSGQFGPFDAREPGRSPIEGSFSLSNADFEKVKGIGGKVDSRGLFSGQLDEMLVDGTADAANFQLDSGSNPLPLHVEFRAKVNGTDGNVHLSSVQARLGGSPFAATGSITRTPGIKGRRVALDLKVPAGRAEDLLTLLLPASRPVMVGDVQIAATFVLPPGEGRAIDRMELKGTVGVTEANFSNRETQARVRELSRRAQGKKRDDPLGGALMGLSGRFVFTAGTARFSALTFRTEGAVVSVAGTYVQQSGVLNLKGTARLQASLSRAVGGVKGFFLKVADPLFRKDGAGAVIPITITGPHDAPKVTLDKGRLFRR